VADEVEVPYELPSRVNFRMLYLIGFAADPDEPFGIGDDVCS
jgi:hypothetical protein